MSNSILKEIKKMQDNIDNKNIVILTNDDNISGIRKKYGNKYLDDISDSEIETKKTLKEEIIENVIKKENDLTEEEKEKFADIIIKYIELDDKQKSLQEEIKDIKKTKKDLEEIILKNLDIMNEKEVTYEKIKLEKKTEEKKQSLTKEGIKDIIKQKLGDEKLTIEIIDLIEKTKNVKYNVSLKRTKI
jgi:hypothetical protein